MHKEALEFVRLSLGSPDTTKMKVLEIGSYDVNGGIRSLFPGSKFVGIDRAAGPGVDFVVEARNFHTRSPFDMVISTEAAEHTPNPSEIVRCAERCLRRGGMFILTCAAAPRRPHSCMGGPVIPPGEHYGNVDPVKMLAVLESGPWRRLLIQHHRDRGDLYVSAVKAMR